MPEVVSDTEAIPTLPALRSLGKLADLRPVILIDNREQDILPFFRLKTERGTLLTGDYSFLGGTEIFSVERKSVQDLVGCCTNSNRDRFFNELARLRGFRFRRLLVVGSRGEIAQGMYRSQLPPKVVFSTLAVIEVRFDCPVVFAPTPEEAAILVEGWAFWAAREVCIQANALARDNGLT